MYSILLNILCIVGGVIFISLAIAFFVILSSRNSPLPHTPEEDEEQMKYIEEWRKKYNK